MPLAGASTAITDEEVASGSAWGTHVRHQTKAEKIHYLSMRLAGLRNAFDTATPEIRWRIKGSIQHVNELLGYIRSRPEVASVGGGDK